MTHDIMWLLLGWIGAWTLGSRWKQLVRRACLGREVSRMLYGNWSQWFDGRVPWRWRLAGVLGACRVVRIVRKGEVIRPSGLIPEVVSRDEWIVQDR